MQKYILELCNYYEIFKARLFTYSRAIRNLLSSTEYTGSPWTNLNV